MSGILVRFGAATSLPFSRKSRRGRGIGSPLDLAGLLRAQLRAAVPADVEDARIGRAGPRDENALPADLDGPEGAGLVEVGGPRGAEPHRLEDRRLFQGEDVASV